MRRAVTARGTASSVSVRGAASLIAILQAGVVRTVTLPG